MSYGKEKIEKIAAFDSIPDEDYFAFNFGDLTADGTIDIYANSNNGDMFKILATIISILKEFLNERPFTRVFFTGSTPKRTALYCRMLRTHYIVFNNEFIISALIKERNGIKEVLFNPISQAEYLGFFIRKK